MGGISRCAVSSAGMGCAACHRVSGGGAGRIRLKTGRRGDFPRRPPEPSQSPCGRQHKFANFRKNFPKAAFRKLRIEAQIRGRSEGPTSKPQSLMPTPFYVFAFKKKTNTETKSNLHTSYH